VRRALGWTATAAAVLASIGLALAWLLAAPAEPAPGPEPGRSLFRAHCVSCHGKDGRGGWRAWAVLLRPGNLAAPEMAALPDRYLTDLIRQGGAGVGKPGMPSFGFALSEAQIEALVAYLRALPRAGARSG